MQSSHDYEIIKGKHDELKEFIYDILRKYPKLNKKNIDMLLTDNVMREFRKVFTTPAADPENNYEFYEILGDSSANNCIVWYCQRRFFPEVEKVKNFKSPLSPLAIMGRLKQSSASTKQFSKFATKLNMEPYITMTSKEKEKPNKILEDVFEAFIGCLVYFTEKLHDMHLGLLVVYPIIESLMDQEDIKIDKESLYEAKSLLNEEITKFPKNTIHFDYVHTPIDPNRPTEGFISKAVISEYNKRRNIYVSTNVIKGKEKKVIEQELAREILKHPDYIRLKAHYNINM